MHRSYDESYLYFVMFYCSPISSRVLKTSNIVEVFAKNKYFCTNFYETKFRICGDINMFFGAKNKKRTRFWRQHIRSLKMLVISCIQSRVSQMISVDTFGSRRVSRLDIGSPSPMTFVRPSFPRRNFYLHGCDAAG